MKKILVALIALVTFAAVPVSAQTYLTNTTLPAAISATQTQIRLASGTNVQAGGGLYIDHEFIAIRDCAVAACTTVNVTRMHRPRAHAISAVVYIATAAQRAAVMLTTDGARRAGSCVLGDQQFLPIIDIDTGDFYACRYTAAAQATRVWAKTNIQMINGVSSLPLAWP